MVTVNQEPLCEEHARERLDDLEAKQDLLESDVAEIEAKYNQLQEKYDVSGYGELEHQLNVEGREDITEDDVQKMNEVESSVGTRRQELRGVEERIRQLEQGLQ